MVGTMKLRPLTRDFPKSLLFPLAVGGRSIDAGAGCFDDGASRSGVRLTDRG